MSGERAQPLATSRHTASLIWAVVVCLGVGLRLTPPAQAQSGIQVVANPAPEYTFGKALTFRLSVTSSAQLSRITLFCQPQAGGGQAWSAPAAFTPGQSVTAVYTRDLTTFSQAPFVNLEYWWQVDDQAGQHLTTPHQNLFYGDNRFGWQTTSQTPVTVHWYQGDAAFGQTALGIASAGLALANGDLQAPLPAQINIYVYATAADAQAALSPAGRIWVEARSDPPLNLIVAVASPGMGAEQILGRQLPHELTHLLIYRLTGDHYADVPTWLNEGLAERSRRGPTRRWPASLAQPAPQTRSCPSPVCASPSRPTRPRRSWPMPRANRWCATWNAGTRPVRSQVCWPPMRPAILVRGACKTPWACRSPSWSMIG